MRPEYDIFRWSRVDLEAAGLLHGDITLSKVDTEDFEDELRLTLSMLSIADLPLFKSRYVLSYVPKGVPDKGWHPVGVRLTHGTADIRARRGYER